MINDPVMHSLHQGALILSALTLCCAALHDIAARTIPNTACAILALLGIGLHLADGTILISLLFATLVFCGCTFCWLRGWMGGGDVKLLAASSLLVPPAAVGTMIVATAMFGGAVA